MVEYDLHLGVFSGPLHKLLELVEARKLEVTEISLAQVTNEFLEFLKTLETVEAPVLADFIAIASRLILIKSKSLLPDLPLTSEEEKEIKDLEYRLRLYQELKPSMRFISKLWSAGHRQFSRSYLLVRQPTGGGEIAPELEEHFFYPGEGITTAAFVESLARLSQILKKAELETKIIREKIITIEEKIAEVVRRLSESGATTLRNLSGEKSRSEIIAIFLALLHLAREQMVHLEQQAYFSDIIVKPQSKEENAQ